MNESSPAKRHNYPVKTDLRRLLTGGDRRGIADSKRVRALVERRPARVKELAALTTDEDWLVTQRAVDLLEKLGDLEQHVHLG